MVLSLAFFFTIVLVIGIIAFKLKIPFVAAYIFAGFIISRFVISEYIHVFADIGVILLMFALGVEFPFKKILSMKTTIFQLAFLQILISSIILLFVFFISGYSLQTSIVFGILMSFSSTVIVAKFLNEKGQIHAVHGETSIGILILQDLIVIPVSIILPILLKTGQYSLNSIFADLLLIFAKSTIIFGILAILSKKIVPKILKGINFYWNKELLLLAVISIGLIMSGIAEKLGFSLAIGAFLAGAAISLTDEKFEIFSEIKPLRDIFGVIFFVYLGFSLNLNFLIKNFILILFFTFLLIIIKFLVLYFLCLYKKIYQKNSFRIALNLSQVSEFAFILAIHYFQQSLLKIEYYEMIVSITLASIVISPFLLKSEEKIILKYKKFFTAKHDQFFNFSENFELNNHVILCGFGRIGQRISKNLEAYGIPFLVIDENKTLIEKLKSRGLKGIYGDATENDILGFSGLAKAKAIVLTIPDKFSQELIISHCSKINPRILIYARAHKSEDKKYLYAMGARYVLYPEFEGAFAMSKRILKLFNITDIQIAKTFRANLEDEKII